MTKIFKPLTTGITAIQEKRSNGVIEITVTDRESYVTASLRRMFTNLYQWN